MSPVRTGLRKREIALAIGLGALATGAAGLILSADEESAYSAVPAVTQGGTLAPFSRVVSIGPQDVSITVGERQSVRARGAADALERLELSVENGVLTIRPRGSFGRGFGRWSGARTVGLDIVVPRLEAVSLTGSGDIQVAGVGGQRFSGQVAGSGDLLLTRLAVDEAELEIAGAGEIIVTGTARDARLSIAGSGEIDGEGFASDTADVSVTGSGDVELTAIRRAAITVRGSGDIEVNGSPQCSVTRFGSGDVRCGGERL